MATLVQWTGVLAWLATEIAVFFLLVAVYFLLSRYRQLSERHDMLEEGR